MLTLALTCLNNLGKTNLFQREPNQRLGRVYNRLIYKDFKAAFSVGIEQSKLNLTT